MDRIKEAMNDPRLLRFIAEEMPEDGNTIETRIEIIKQAYASMPEHEVREIFEKAFSRLNTIPK